MKRFRGAAAAVCLGLTLAVAVGSTASAFSILQQSGNHGEWGSSNSTPDDSRGLAARCGYSAPDASGFAHLAWIKVAPFKAQAYNRTGAVDHQPVTFMVTVQRSGDGGSTWSNVGSLSQTRTAYDNLSASFSSLKVLSSGKDSKLYRAVVTLKWLRNGQTDGLVRVSLDYYSVKWTVGDPAFVFVSSCSGTAD